MDNKKDFDKCPKCGTVIPKGSSFCGVCGYNFYTKNDVDVPNTNTKYAEKIKENGDNSVDKDVVGLVTFALIAKFVLPFAIPFVFGWLIFGGLSGDSSNFWSVLIKWLIIIVVAIIMPVYFIYRLAARESSERDKKIFFIGLLLLIAAIVLFYFLYLRK